MVQKSHRYEPMFANLSFTEEYFGEPLRWKCAGCAYEQGMDDALNGRSPNINLSILDQSQAGSVRHKDPHEAYDLGYAAGIAARAVNP